MSNVIHERGGGEGGEISSVAAKKPGSRDARKSLSSISVAEIDKARCIIANRKGLRYDSRGNNNNTTLWEAVEERDGQP